jgi:hypothetical protein
LFTPAFDNKLRVVDSKYDEKKLEVTWNVVVADDLKKLKEIIVTFHDMDNVQIGTAKLRLDPNKAEYKKGDKIKAIVVVPNKTVLKETIRAFVREKK